MPRAGRLPNNSIRNDVHSIWLALPDGFTAINHENTMVAFYANVCVIYHRYVTVLAIAVCIYNASTRGHCCQPKEDLPDLLCTGTA